MADGLKAENRPLVPAHSFTNSPRGEFVPYKEPSHELAELDASRAQRTLPEVGKARDGRVEDQYWCGACTLFHKVVPERLCSIMYKRS